MPIKQSKKYPAVKIDHEFLNNCASNRDLHKKTFRVLLHLLTIADSRKFVSISQKDIAEAISIDRTSVSLALKDLKDHGIIHHIVIGQNVMFADHEEDEEEEFE